MHFGIDHPKILSFTEENRWLSNFWPSPIRVPLFGAERNFATGEHYYQALKAHAMPSKELVDYRNIDNYIISMEATETPGKAKRLGQKANIDTERWNRIAFHHMMEVQMQKYSQNFELAQKLINTGSTEFVEGNTWGDTTWGTVDGEGLNLLGLALTMTRDKLYAGELQVAFRSYAS